MKRVIRKMIWAVVLLALLGGGTGWYLLRSGDPPPSFRTAPVTRGELLATIGATGTVMSEELVEALEQELRVYWGLVGLQQPLSVFLAFFYNLILEKS